jgi:hypothetical protein
MLGPPLPDVIPGAPLVAGALRGCLVVGASVMVGASVVVGGAVVVGASVVVGALPQDGNPGSGALSGPLARNTVGIHTPTLPIPGNLMLPLPTHAHQELARLPTEYRDPCD